MGKSIQRGAVAVMSLTEHEQYLDMHPDPRIARIGVSFLDGFLAATIVGPHLVAQSRWLTQIFGTKVPGGQGDRAGEFAIAAIVARHDEILDVLTHHPQDFAPIFMRTDAGEVTAADWSDGFFGAIKLNAAAWQPLVSNPTSTLLMPIFMFCRDADGDSVSAPALAAASATQQKLIGEGWRHIPEAVGAILAFWLTRPKDLPGSPLIGAASRPAICRRALAATDLAGRSI